MARQDLAHVSLRISERDRLALDALVEASGQSTSDIVRSGLRTYAATRRR